MPKWNQQNLQTRYNKRVSKEAFLKVWKQFGSNIVFRSAMPTL